MTSNSDIGLRLKRAHTCGKGRPTQVERRAHTHEKSRISKDQFPGNQVRCGVRLRLRVYFLPWYDPLPPKLTLQGHNNQNILKSLFSLLLVASMQFLNYKNQTFLAYMYTHANRCSPTPMHWWWAWRTLPSTGTLATTGPCSSPIATFTWGAPPSSSPIDHQITGDPSISSSTLSEPTKDQMTVHANASSKKRTTPGGWELPYRKTSWRSPEKL